MVKWPFAGIDQRIHQGDADCIAVEVAQGLGHGLGAGPVPAAGVGEEEQKSLGLHIGPTIPLRSRFDKIGLVVNNA